MTSVVRAVLFDLDGTLLDTAPDMVAALNTLLHAEGRAALPYDEVRPFVSHGSARLVRLGFPDVGPGTLTDLQQRYLDIYGSALSVHTRLFPGMDQVLAELATSGIPCGIVTNKPAALTNPLLEQLGLSSRFACVVSGDTVSERKPHPMPMLHAARLVGVAPLDCVYVGDAERDIQAAHAASMKALVATYGYLEPDEDWRAWGGDGFIRASTDLLSWLERNRA
jgi:2-phosphoglycolate phosphatase